jgi:hypothetical protein
MCPLRWMLPHRRWSFPPATSTRGYIGLQVPGWEIQGSDPRGISSRAERPWVQAPRSVRSMQGFPPRTTVSRRRAGSFALYCRPTNFCAWTPHGRRFRHRKHGSIVLRTNGNRFLAIALRDGRLPHREHHLDGRNAMPQRLAARELRGCEVALFRSRAPFPPRSTV